jgi:orotidine-5'-phosphate decarboxylase
MNQQQLLKQIKLKKSFLCVGLDTDILKIPGYLKNNPDPVFSFNKAIVDATAKYAVAYKPNLAFYESLGWRGWESLEKTVAYIRSKYPEIFLIADAKRGDIGNTASLYARAFFDKLDFDAVTVVPYMGEDSVRPFLSYPDKWVIILALTSNEGAGDFQFLQDKFTGDELFKTVLKVSKNWGTSENIMYVAGATRSDKLKEIRSIVPGHFLLVPGIGAQGGSLKETAESGLNSRCGLLVNSSRAIIYASRGDDFAEKAGIAAQTVRDEMSEALEDRQII